MTVHKVTEGETLRSVAASYGISPIKLAAMNGLCESAELFVGQQLVVVIPTRTATARRGESLADIARRFDKSEASLLAMNPDILPGARLYDGQPIAVRWEPPLFGLGIANGYLYRGWGRERLLSTLPYLNYLTVSAAVISRGDAVEMFDAREAIEIAREAKKTPLLRVWAPEGERYGEEALRSLASLALASGCVGVTLGGRADEKEIETAKRILGDSGLLTVAEVDLTAPERDTSAADMTVLIYDKAALGEPPDFADGEDKLLSDFAERSPAWRTFVDLSPFASAGDKFVTRDEAIAAVTRSGGKAEEIGNSGCLRATVGHGGSERTYVWQGAVGTERRLRLVSEQGYLGVSFDVSRTPIADLVMLRSMFSEAMSAPAQPKLNCTGEQL